MDFQAPQNRRRLDTSARYARAGGAQLPSALEGSALNWPKPNRRILNWHGERAAHGLLLAVILLGSFLLKLHHLDHANIKPLDELFHAIVSRNLLKHPLTPTLVDKPYLAYDSRDWQANHIWLHKPPMALWQIAISFAIFGVKTFSLRLPSAILSTLAAWLTYLIGAELLDRTAGLVAAALQAFNPVILMLVHGYVFSDHVDISLLFWCEVGIYFLARSMRTGRWPDLLICGIAQGLAFLSKSYPALIVIGLAAVVWILPRIRIVPKSQRDIRGKSLGIIVLAAVITALPWTFYTAIRFPDEFRYENLHILSHLGTNVEGWAAPWDRVVFGYWISIFHIFYPAILAAMVLMCISAIKQKRIALWFLIAWFAGVALPNLLATSKTMSATLTAWPAAWLMLGYLISQALRGQRGALATLLSAVALAAIFVNARSIPSQGGFGPADAGSALVQNQWVLWMTLAAISLGALVAPMLRNRAVFKTMVAVATLLTLVLAGRWWKGDHPPGYGVVAWKVTQIDKGKPNFRAMGAFAATLPANAAFIVQEQDRLDNKLLEFASDRSCYPLQTADWRLQAIVLADGGAVPFLVTTSTEPLPVLFTDHESNYKLYSCSPQGPDNVRVPDK
jgi:4-amino-4-deoxy-L-arabinose transferase